MKSCLHISDVEWTEVLQSRERGCLVKDLAIQYGVSESVMSNGIRNAQDRKRVCPTCGGVGNWRNKYCSVECRQANQRAKTLVPEAEKICPICGTKFTGTGKRKYCSRQCCDRADRIAENVRERVRRSERQRPPRPAKVCPICGDSFSASPHVSQVYCGMDCRTRASRARIRVPAPKVIVNKRCERCGEGFGCSAGKSKVQKYCSHACAKRAGHRNHEHVRRARKRNAYVAPVSFAAIAMRDGWRCGICGKPVPKKAVVPNPLAPTLDHIIPLAKGGTHEPKNVQLAHFLCNSVKSDKGGGQLRFM